MSVTSERTRKSQPPGGPPPAGLAGIALALLVGGLVASAALGGTIPSVQGEAAAILDYFAQQPAAVRAAAAFTFGCAVPLTLYAATVSTRLRSLGATAPGATIALAGGVLSAAMLTLSALSLWVLSRPAGRTEAPLVRALHDLSFLSGGAAHLAFLGLLIAGIAVPGLLLDLLPRPLAITGLVIAVVAEVATVSLLWEPAAILLPLARFPGLVWLIVAGYRLPRRGATPLPSTA